MIHELLHVVFDDFTLLVNDDLEEELILALEERIAHYAKRDKKRVKQWREAIDLKLSEASDDDDS